VDEKGGKIRAGEENGARNHFTARGGPWIETIPQHPIQVPMIYLVGVDHQVQHDGPTMIPEREKALSDFSHFLGAKAIELRISLMAEEFNEEAMKRNHATKSTVRHVAKCLGLRHLFCDPTSIQRRDLGIHKDQNLREEYWLSRLNGYVKTETILFVCGADHLNTRYDKLTHRGLRVVILQEQFGIGLPPPILFTNNEAITQELEL